MSKASDYRAARKSAADAFSAVADGRPTLTIDGTAVLSVADLEEGVVAMCHLDVAWKMICRHPVEVGKWLLETFGE